MAEPSDSSLAFFSKGTPKQWEFVYELRKDVIRLKADQRSSKKGGPEEFIKLDNWFREKLPQSIHSRKDPHVVYEELVQIAKWRLMMGKYRPKMLDLVRINTESSVLNITRKAFKKLSHQKNLQQAINMLVNLKGIGPSTASAVLAAAYPDAAPFMSDEGMLSTPGVEATDSTLSEYNNYSEQIRNKTQSLRDADPDFQWTPHKVDQTLWVYYLARDLKPQLLDDMPRGEDCVMKKFSTSVVDANDDNANVVPANEEENINNGGVHHLNNGNGNNNSNHHDATSTSLSSLDKNECLNGVYNEDSSASVPYSEEDVSQGGASCSSMNADSTLVNMAPSITSLTNGITTNGNSGQTVSTLSSSVGFDDSKDCLDSEDSRGALLLSSSTTPSEENSVDEAGPPLKRQKTLELSSALAAATADVTEV